VREQSVDDHGIYAYNYSWSSNADDDEPVYGYPLVLSERVVEGIVLEGEGLMERLDLVYNVEGADEDAVAH
jgi:hypothetical protein